MKKTIITLTFATAALLSLLSSCYKQDDIYKQFVVTGGLVYPAMPINLESQAGYKRIILSWDKPMDPAVKTAKVFWENYTKSSEELKYSDYPDGHVEISIPNLDERAYTFDIKNYDANGNISLAAEITVSPYGDFWLSALSERKVTYARMGEESNAMVVMSPSTDQMVSTSLRYVNAEGKLVEIAEPLSVEEDTIRLSDAMKGKRFQHRSCFRPEKGADVVWSEWVTSTGAMEYQIPTSTFTVTATSNQVQGAYTPDKIFDGVCDVAANRYYASTSSSYRTKFPKVLAIDMNLEAGDAYSVTSFDIYQHPTTSSSRYLKNYYIFFGDEPFDPNDSKCISEETFGPYSLKALAPRTDAKYSNTIKERNTGRYMAFVFADSYSGSSYNDLWELVLYGFKPSEAELPVE